MKRMQKELYLNLQIVQVGAQLIGRPVVDDGHAETARSFQVERPVINEDTLFGLALRDGESHTENVFRGLAGMDVAGTEEDLKASPKIERFDAILVQLERLVVDGADEVAIGGGALVENCAACGKLLGLSEHESGELFAREFARAVEKCAVEIFVERKLA